MMTARQESDVVLDDGLKLHIVESGAADGVPVLLIHGYIDSSQSFCFLMQKPISGFRFVAVDLRGYGDSDVPDGPMSVDVFARDLLALIDKLGIERAILVGHSMGSLIAQKMAATSPARVAGLVLVGSTSSVIGNPLLTDLQKQVETLTDPVDRDFVREFQATDVPLPQAFVDEHLEVSYKIPASVWKRALKGLLETDHGSLLSEIKCPVAIFWGRTDLVFDEKDQEKLRKGLPDASFVSFDGGHCFQWELPDAFREELAQVLASICGGQEA